MKTSAREPRVHRPSFIHRVLALLLAFLMAVPPQVRAAGVSTAVTVSSTYDGNGNVTSRTDGNGVVTAYTYDAMNRVTGIDYPGGTTPDVSFTYDANGNRASMTDATGVTTYGHDFYDRLTRVDYPDGGFVVYGYDFVGNVTEMLYGNTKAVNAGKGYTDVQYTYDADNRIASVKNVFANTTTSYTYNDAGHPLRRTLPNGVTTDYGYDSDGRLVSVDHKKADTTRICKYTYTLNAIGNRTQVVETLPDASTKTTSYTYDALDRLSTATYPDGRSVTYLYDSFGNRTKMTEVTGTTKVTDYTYDNDSRLLSTKVNNVAEETFSYDTTGNLIQRVRASDNRQIDYAYDVENRLIRYYDGTNNVQYVYNGSGYRTAKIVNGVRINYVNDMNRQYVQVLTETDTSGNAQRVYEWGNEIIDQVAGSTRGYHLHDAINGSIRRVVDAAGVIANSYEYDAFGIPTAKTEGVANDYQFHGEAQEEESGLVFLRSRFVDPGTARFLTRDVTRGARFNASELNPYIFVGNDPVNKRDPSGEFAPLLAIGVGAAIGSLVEGGVYIANNWSNLTSADAATRANARSGALDAFGSGAVTGAAAVAIPMAAASLALAAGASTAVTAATVATAKFATGFASSYATADAGISQTARIGESLAGGVIGLVEGPFKTNFRNTTTVPGLFTASNRVNLAKEFGNELVGKSMEGGYDFSVAAGSYLTGYAATYRPGGVALNKSASVLLDINTITGGTYDVNTGQIILFGKQDTSPTALPKMSLDDLAVAVKAKQLGTFPVVSIEDPIVTNQPDWPGRECATVRYGPFYTDSLDGQRKVLDVSSKTHFGWVMFEADRLMKSLGLGKDNRTLQTVSSAVPGYQSWMNLAFQYQKQGSVKSRFWFNPKEIVVQPSPDGKSMQITKADMQLSTETMFASNGQTESTPDAEYFATWFTNNYDAIAEEQVSYDDSNQPHKIFKELKQLAYLAGVVKWIADNNVPVDLGFLKDYQPTYFPSAPSVTPQTTFSEERFSNGGNGTIRFTTVTITGGVNFCNDLVLGTGGNPTGLGAAAASARPGETSLGWSFSNGGQSYNATALSVDRTEKAGAMSPAVVDAQFKVKGSMPLVLGRYFDSFNNTPTLFGWGWKAQPYALEFKGNRETFSICHQTWSGYGEAWFTDRASGKAYKMVPSGTYDKAADPQGLASRFDPTKDILVYRYESKAVPGLLFSDNYTHMTMKLNSGELLDFNFDGVLTRTEDRNGNRIDYAYDGNKRLTSISQAGVRTITLNYDAQNRVATASLPGSRTVTYAYSASGDLISAQPDAPTGRIAKYSYDANHNLLQMQDESGNAAATQAFDVYGRVSGTTQPGVATPFTQTYNLASKTSQMTGPNGAASATEFNSKNDPTKMTDARGNFTTMTYNSYRDLTSATTPDSKTRQFYYDGSGRRAATVQPNSRVDRAFFNSFGSPTMTFHGQVDSIFINAFDAEHVMTSAAYGYYSVNYTQYGYDAKGNRTSVTDANSHVQQFGYDAAGNMSWSRDARGKQTDFTYDTNTRLTRVRNALSHQVDMTYDTRDNLTQVATAAGTVDFAYNLKNQVTSVTTGNVGARHTTSYAYDAKGQISTVTDPNNKVTQYTYDARGNLTAIVHDGISRFTYDYDGMNRLTATHYTGTAGGARPSLVPTAPVGGELLRGGSPMVIQWFTQGDWTGNTNVTIQYSTDGVNWTNIATVLAANGTYTWGTPVNSNTLRLRFVRTGDSTFRNSTTAPFMQVATVKYYVNDGSTAGDQYCTAAGQTYNGTTVTGRSPSNPVNDPQAIFDNNVLLPGDIVYIDTGNYALNHDFLITQADSGTAAVPVTIQGPTSGTGATISRVASANPNNAVIVVVDTNTADSTPMQGLAIQNIKTGAGRIGMWFIDAQYCTVRDCECSQATIPGAAGVGGDGIGILLQRGGNHLIERNRCHDNGGTGGAGSAGNAGGSGTGSGIFSLTSNSNAIQFNECYNNRGTGAVGGSTTALAGKSLGFGIKIQGCNATLISDNICHDNDSIGVSSSTGLPGDAEAYGIFFNSNTATFVERNVCYGNDATGGTSSAKNGGASTAIGLLDYNESGARVANNRCYNNKAVGGLSSTAAGFTNGSAEARGITVSSSPNALTINNLCYGNNANASPRRGAENSGLAIGCGIRIEQNSPGATILHNTVERNNAVIGNLGSVAGASGLQIVVISGSTGVTVKNNASGAEDFYGACIYVDDSCKTGFVSDYNDFYLVNPSSSVGQWGSAGLNDLLADWQSASGQDSHSLSVDPQYYNQAASNYHLKSSSPIIDIGILLASAGVDVDGENRPQKGPNPALPLAPDIGYDEFKDSDGDGLADAIETSVTLTNPNDADTDHDGLPDGWEVANSLNPNSAVGVNGGNGDADGDTYTNLAEFLGGSNPNLANSIPPQPPVITSALPAETNPLILEEESIAFSATATDANGQTVAYSWRLDGVVKSTTNSYNFTTNDASSGLTSLSKSYTVELSVTAGGDTVKRTWTVTVGNRNRPPVLQPISAIRIRPGQTIQLNPVYSDPDNQNAVSGDDNLLTVTYTGFMNSPTKTVSAGDVGTQTVTVAVQDNGNPALSAEQTFQVSVINSGAFIDTPGGSALSVVEGGVQTGYSLTLNSRPTDPVTIGINGSSQLTANPLSVTFTPASWNVPQPVTVSAVDNLIVDGNRIATIVHTTTSADAIYNGVSITNLDVNITDNDVAGLVIAQSGGATIVTEGGASDSYTIALSSQPTASVTVNVNPGNQLTVNPPSVTFSSANWNVPQAVASTAPDDHVAQGNRDVSVVHTPVSTDGVYAALLLPGVTVTIHDRPADNWKHSKFTAAELSNPSVSGDLADPNHNGISNLLEYALNGDPTSLTAATAILPVGSRNIAANCFQMNLNRYLDRTDITMTIQACDSVGGDWSDLATSVNGSAFAPATGGVSISESGTGNARNVTVCDVYPLNDPAHPQRYMRLKVTKL
jgi:RHS repeat-associated protein